MRHQGTEASRHREEEEQRIIRRLRRLKQIISEDFSEWNSEEELGVR